MSFLDIGKVIGRTIQQSISDRSPNSNSAIHQPPVYHLRPSNSGDSPSLSSSGLESGPPQANSLPPTEVRRNFLFEAVTGDEKEMFSLTEDPYDNPFLTQEDDNDPDTDVGGSWDPLPDYEYPPSPEDEYSDTGSGSPSGTKEPADVSDHSRPNSQEEEDDDDDWGSPRESGNSGGSKPQPSSGSTSTSTDNKKPASSKTGSYGQVGESVPIDADEKKSDTIHDQLERLREDRWIKPTTGDLPSISGKPPSSWNPWDKDRPGVRGGDIYFDLPNTEDTGRINPTTGRPEPEHFPAAGMFLPYDHERSVPKQRPLPEGDVKYKKALDEAREADRLKRNSTPLESSDSDPNTAEGDSGVPSQPLKTPATTDLDAAIDDLQDTLRGSKPEDPKPDEPRGARTEESRNSEKRNSYAVPTKRMYLAQADNSDSLSVRVTTDSKAAELANDAVEYMTGVNPMKAMGRATESILKSFGSAVRTFDSTMDSLTGTKQSSKGSGATSQHEYQYAPSTGTSRQGKNDRKASNVKAKVESGTGSSANYDWSTSGYADYIKENKKELERKYGPIPTTKKDFRQWIPRKDLREWRKRTMPKVNLEMESSVSDGGMRAEVPSSKGNSRPY